MRTTINTRYHIDLEWWSRRGRNLRRFLAAILEDESAAAEAAGVLDYIDPVTGEVYSIDNLWARVLIERSGRPDYITSSTPLTNAVLRALIENLNHPMTPMELHRRIARGTPEAILRVLRTAQTTYGIAPAPGAKPAGSTKAPPKGAKRKKVAARR